MSGPVSSAFEVVADTRRRWSEEEKLALLAEAAEGTVSVSAVARRHGISRDLLFRWRREERKKAERADARSGFVALSLPAPRAKAGGGIEVALSCGVRLIVGEGTDLALLKRVVAALQGS